MIVHIASTMMLVFISIICLIGIIHHSYNDSLLERIGMSITALWCLLRASAISVHANNVYSSGEVFLYTGIFCFALGTANAKWRAWRQTH